MSFLRKFACLVAVLIGAATSVSAQSASDLPRIVTSPILVIQSERLYAESEFGKRVAQERDEAIAALEAENERVASELEDEERVLT